jgi:hypothetical protein
VRFRGLAQLKRPDLQEKVLGALPEAILMVRYALEKAFKINELVQAIHKGSYEWYGYTIARRENPEVIVDIGLPRNDQNISDYTSVGPEGIAEYQESLPRNRVINGWIHSHASLEYERFSLTDELNQRTVLDFVSTLLRTPIAKKEVVIKDLVLLVKDGWTEEDFARGSVTLITDAPVKEARLLETIYGGFCYSIVIGDGGWHRQEIHYRHRGILSGQAEQRKKEAELVLLDTDRALSGADIDGLAEEVRAKIRPGKAALRERYEKEAT